MKQTKKILAVVLALVLSLSLLPTTGVSAASKKVKLNKTKATIYVGKTVTLKLKNNKKKVKWSTSNKKVATVTKKGKVKGKKAGKATITAKVGKKKYKCKITVKKKATPKPTPKPTEKPTTSPTEQPTTKPVEQPTTKPVEEPTTKPSTDENADWEFEENETGVSITRYKGTDTDVMIPSEIQAKRVTSIGSSAFYGCSSLISVTIPDGVTSIDSSVFYGCSSLTSVTIPNSVTSIGSRAFYECSSLSSVTIPDGVTSIEEYAFYGCGGLDNITIPKNVTSIGMFAFGGCYVFNFIIYGEYDYDEPKTFIDPETGEEIIIPVIPKKEKYRGARICDEKINGVCIKDKKIIGVVNKSMKEIIIPEGVTSIGYGVFFDCSSLEKITIPKSVTSIENAFDRFCCIKKENFVNYSALNEEKEKYWGAVIYDEEINGLYIAGTTIVGVISYDIKEVNIPDSVTSIGKSAFLNCSSLENIIIPESVTSIENYAFFNCFSLENITIPDSVTSIGEDALGGCSNLKNINVKAGSYAETWAKENGYTFVAE